LYQAIRQAGKGRGGEPTIERMRTSHEATLGGKVQPLGSAQPERGVVYVGVCGLGLIGCLVAAVVRHWFFFIAALAARSAPSKSAPRRSPFKSRVVFGTVAVRL
jgi:hypothetical protein